jgi:HEAT repeat protein
MPSRIGIALVVLGLLGAAAPAQAESSKERAAKLMKKLATDKKPEVRADAAKQLGDLGAWDDVPALAAALKDPSAEVRAGAAYALVELKDKAKDAVPALKEALGDRDRLVVYNVVVALHNMEAGTPAELAPPLRWLVEQSDREDRESLVRMFVNLGFEDATARKAILDTLEQGRPELRLQILQELWHQETLRQSGAWKAEVIAHLTPLVTSDRDPKVRREAIVLLWHAHAVSGPVGEALLKALDDPDPEVASQAAGTLNGLEHSPLPATAITHLTQKLKSPDPLQRAAAAHALGGFIGWREKFTPLLTAALLGDKDPAVRLAVVEALGEIDDDNAIPALLKALKTDGDARVKAAICTNWSKPMVKLRFARTNNLEAALAALEAARGDANPRVKAAAEAALAELQK